MKLTVGLEFPDTHPNAMLLNRMNIKIDDNTPPLEERTVTEFVARLALSMLSSHEAKVVEFKKSTMTVGDDL